MRPIQATLLAATFAAAAAFLPQAASAASTGYTTATVNLRTGPSTSYNVLTSVPAGSRITVFSCTSWCNVDWHGFRGWMSARYVSGGGYAPPPPPPPRYYNPYPPVYIYPDHRPRRPDWRPNPWDHKPSKWDNHKPPKWDDHRPPNWDGNKPPKWDHNKPPPNWNNNNNNNNNNPKPWQNGKNDHPKQPQTFVPSDAAPGRPYCRLEDGKMFCN